MPDNNKIVEFINLTSAVAKTATAEITKLKQASEKTAKAAELVSTAAEKTADALLKAGHLKPADRSSAIEALQDPVKALDYMAKLAGKASATNPATIGMPVGKEKQASVGAKTERVEITKASDESWVRNLLGNRS